MTGRPFETIFKSSVTQYDLYMTVVIKLDDLFLAMRKLTSIYIKGGSYFVDQRENSKL